MHKPLYCLTHTADTPWGEVWLAASDTGLYGLWFQKQNHFPKNLPAPSETAKTASLSAQIHMDAALRYLHNYIQGRPLNHIYRLHPLKRYRLTCQLAHPFSNWSGAHF